MPQRRVAGRAARGAHPARATASNRACSFWPRPDSGALADIPFRQAAAAPKSVPLYFLAEAPRDPDLAAMDAAKAAREAFALAGKDFFLHTPDGFGKSKRAARGERCLGIAATARNPRTVAAPVAPARSVQGAA